MKLFTLVVMMISSTLAHAAAQENTALNDCAKESLIYSSKRQKTVGEFPADTTDIEASVVAVSHYCMKELRNQSKAVEQDDYFTPGYARAVRDAILEVFPKSKSLVDAVVPVNGFSKPKEGN